MNLIKGKIMSLWLKIFMLFVLGCAGSVMAKGADKELTGVVIGDTVFKVHFPSNESKDFGINEPLMLVDLSNETLQKDGFLPIVTKYWDFGGGWFQAVNGTLKVIVWVRKIPDDIINEVTGIESLKKKLDRYRLTKKNATVSEGVEIEINERQWLNYRVSQNSNHLRYETLISKQFYILIQGDFINNSGKKHLEWLDEADEMLTGIVKSVELEKIEGSQVTGHRSQGSQVTGVTGHRGQVGMALS